MFHFAKHDLAIILAQSYSVYSVEKTISFRRILQAPDKYRSLSGDTFYEWVSAQDKQKYFRENVIIYQLMIGNKYFKFIICMKGKK